MEPVKHDEHGIVILPQPEDIPKKEKDYAAASYIMMFASQYFPLPLANLIAAFIFYMFCKKTSRFLAFHTYQSLISQIPTSLATWGLVAWIVISIVNSGLSDAWIIFDTFFWIVCATILTWNLIYMIFSLIAYRRAGKGRIFYLPIFGKLAYSRYFGPNAINYKPAINQSKRNLPPPSF